MRGFYPGFYIDPYYIMLVIPAMLLALYAQMKVKTTFSKYSNQFSRRGYTATEVARMILDKNGLNNITISRVAGSLTDHFDPRNNTVSLSESVYDSTSVASIGVAAHEVGHAIQHAKSYAPIKIRNTIVPIVNIGSKISIPLAILGFALGNELFVTIGLVLFSGIVFFQLVTLPVEFNASSRAMKSISEFGILESDEASGAKKVLSAAAMTYVAAAITSIASLIRIIAIFGNRRRN